MNPLWIDTKNNEEEARNIRKDAVLLSSQHCLVLCQLKFIPYAPDRLQCPLAAGVLQLFA